MMIRHLLFMMSMLLVLAACDGGDQGEEPIAEPNEEPATEQKDDDSPTEDDQDQSDKQAEDQNGEVLTETGIDNGQAEGHTIEIETDDGPGGFQLSRGARAHGAKAPEDGEDTQT